MQGRRALSRLFFELLLVAVNRVVFLLVEAHEVFVQTDERALLEKIPARVSRRGLSIFFKDDATFSESNASRKYRHLFTRAAQRFVNLFSGNR